MRARYYDGVISAERQKYRSAVQAFNDVVEARPSVATAEEAAQLEEMRDLAVMNIARIYYELERYDTSEVNYRMVARDSSYWPQSLFERAWATFVQQDLNRTLGLLLTVESPYFSSGEYLPEVTLLRALTYFNLCEYGEVERILIDFDKRYAPQKAELEAFLDQYKTDEGRKLADQAFETYFENKKTESQLEVALFARVLRNRELSAHVRSLDSMDAEVALIDAQKALWKDTVGDGLKQIIEADRLRYKKQAGRVLLQELLEQYRVLADLLIQSEVVRFEVVDAQRQDYEFKMQNPDVAAGDEARVDFATDPKRIYWPFNGEFWRDELGFYKYAEHGACK
jgi:tetratricopeptide (TPR) repeat protein